MNNEYDDLLGALIRAYVERQANPDRIGCPPVQTLEALLLGRLPWESLAGLSEHLHRCRECLRELKGLAAPPAGGV